MAVTFTLGGTTVTFSRAPARPARSLKALQPELQATGAERIGHDAPIKNDLLPLAWSGMSAANLASLLSFWKTTVRGMVATFTYTDSNGAAFTVRFASPRLPQFREKAYDRYDVSVLLRVQ